MKTKSKQERIVLTLVLLLLLLLLCSLLLIVFVYVFMDMVDRSGGTNEVLRNLNRYTTRTRMAQFVLFTMGILTFFDSYASILVVGKVIGSILKGFPISLEKIAFLIDTTALPVSSIMPGSSLIVYTKTLFQSSLSDTEDGDGIDSVDKLVMSSLKYQFYPILILLLTFLQIGLGREAGPILNAENSQRKGYGQADKELSHSLSEIRKRVQVPERFINWFIPVLLFNVLLWIAFIRLTTQESFQEDTYAALASSTWMTSTAMTVVLVQMFFLLQPKEMPNLESLLFWRKNNERLAYLTDTFPSGSSSIPHTTTSKSDGLETNIDKDFGHLDAESPKNDEQVQSDSVEARAKRCSCTCT